MKVILSRDVPKVGKEGEVLEVADGYARNFLFPRQLAVAANTGTLKTLAKRNDVLARKAGAAKGDAEGVALRLEGQSVTVRGKAGANSTKLFGAITAAHIADAVKEQHNLALDRRRIVLVDPIKTVGEHEVPIHLHHDVNVVLKVLVQPEA